MKKALIVIGELRFINAGQYQRFLLLVRHFDIFIATSSLYEKPCKVITSNYTIDNFIDIKNNKKQFYRLITLLNKYKQKLIQYDAIFKMRTDLTFDKPICEIDDFEPNTLYSFTDAFFYAESSHFIQVFEKLQNDIEKENFKISYSNLFFSDIDSCKFEWSHSHLHFIISFFKYTDSRIIKDTFIPEKFFASFVNQYTIVKNIPFNVSLMFDKFTRQNNMTYLL